MASYDVKCKNKDCEMSKVTTEIKKKMSEDYPPCAECGSEVESVFQTTTAVVFKGGGWCKKRR